MEEKKKRQKLTISPVGFFTIATIIVIILSGILSFFDVQTTGIVVKAVTNDVDSYVIAIESMLSIAGFQYIISNAVSNFVGFAPLGMIILALAAIGIARKTELLKAIFTIITTKLSKKLITFLVVFISVLSSIYIDAAYVLIIPLSALLFLANGRNPIIGIIAAFAGITGGYGITVLVSALDSSISAYTSIAARLLDPAYGVTIWSNIYMMGLGTILIAYVGMIVTERIIVPRIGKLNAEEDEIFIIGNKEVNGLINAAFVAFGLGLILIYAIIPGLPGSGFLLDDTTANYVNKLFGAGSYFYKGGTLIFSFMLILASIAYGLTTKTIKPNSNIIKGSLDGIGNIIILLFAASQFIAIFKQTNIGPFITGSLTNTIDNLNFTGIPLILLFLVVVIISNLFLTSPVSKWMIMSPVIVPMFMQANISPEFTQMIFRIGQSVSNGITPLLAYFIVFVAFVDRYNNQEKEITIGRCLSYTIPYSLAFIAVWLILIITFYLVGLPIGINANPTL